MVIVLRVLMYGDEQVISRLDLAGSGRVHVPLPRHRSMGSGAIHSARWGAPRSATSAGSGAPPPRPAASRGGASEARGLGDRASAGGK
eukprot:15437643-Alexandrium_andersonii.AAC.1